MMTLRDQIIHQAMIFQIADGWSCEIDWRIAAYDTGKTAAVNFDVALENMRQVLEVHRVQMRRQ